MEFVELAPEDERLARDAFPVLAQLRTELTPEQLAAVYAEGHPQGLRFTAAYENGRCVAVAGWRLIANTASLRTLYVDDLVTSSERRSSGVGAELLGELRERARRLGCRALELDSAVVRERAHRFYFREQLSITAFHFREQLH
jgi:GNAT superfamily N-acetyltransferase